MNIVNANIAIVLTDIIGSTKFVQKNGANLAATWFTTHDKFIMSLLTKFNGQLIDSSDGHLMYFNTVQDSLAFSFSYRASLKKHKFPFEVRIGIHYDSMLIIRNSQLLVDANHKKLSLEGLGKSIAARTMSICNADQILLTSQAYLSYKKRVHSHASIPRDAFIVCAGLYQFKGVSEPEQIWIAAFSEKSLQPPKDSEKVKRIAGPNKIKLKLKYKKLKDKVSFFFWRLSILYLLFFLYIFWPLLSSPTQKKMWNIDFWFLVPLDYLNLAILMLNNVLR